MSLLEGGSPKLSRRVFDPISATDQPIFVSAATFWEIAIKRRSGKLVFKGSVREMAAAVGFTELAIGRAMPNWRAPSIGSRRTRSIGCWRRNAAIEGSV